MELTGIQRQLLDTVYSKDNPPADRRTPRMFSSPNPTASIETPYHLDFCKWLQSAEFGNNRILLIVACGGTWLGSKVTW